MALLICFQNLLQAQDRPDGMDEVPTITITELDVTDKNIEVNYEIRNGFEQDIWLCEFTSGDMISEVYLAKDDRTLMVRRRLSVPMNVKRNQAIGRYLRLRKGESRTESLSLSLPANYLPEFKGMRRLPGLVYATRLCIEIGYYEGDLPGKIFSILEEVESKDIVPYVRPAKSSGRTVRDWLRGSLTFNEMNETSQDRDEQVVIPWMNQALEGERILTIVAEGLRIPYKWKFLIPKVRPPDLTSCTAVKIHYTPSMLEYFFPFRSQQDLLSSQEKKYLRSESLSVADNPQEVKALAGELGEQKKAFGQIVCDRSNAYVVCYHDDRQLTSFRVYEDTFIETNDKQRYRHRERLHSLKMITPQVRSFQSRIHCATNLKNLWYRLHLYHKAEKVLRKEALGGSKIVYPSPAEWCDIMLPAYASIGMLEHSILKPYRCPSAGEGRCHYAMNPNCKPNSPMDMVLLFETEAGWNKHGGPELFTFDNHDPKGGCVLLNDGTVKFIRTGQEVQQLRWK
jgi:hypothetical protein